MKGFVLTPEKIVDSMVEKLFDQSPPRKSDRILDPGCGTGAFIEGIIRWCSKNNKPLPHIIGVESNPIHIQETIRKFDKYPSVDIRHQDFLLSTTERYDYIICNPPYVPITGLSEDEKVEYKRLFTTAQGRFDLYILFFEQSLRSLKRGGRLVFVTPEKFIYVATASKLRELLGRKQVVEIQMISEGTFGYLTTYPTITVVDDHQRNVNTRIIFRDERVKEVKLPTTGVSWLPIINGVSPQKKTVILEDIILRVSCGVATGADSVYVRKTKELSPELQKFAYPTISGRELVEEDMPSPMYSMLIPYSENGDLLPESQLNSLINYLTEPENFEKLNSRTCVARKPWYAFHENPPLNDILKPKILCKDITTKAHFWIDWNGRIVPKHSVYYIIPKNPSQIRQLCDYLNSEEVSSWLEAHCQRAANGFLRLQSNILKCIPVPGILNTEKSECNDVF